MSNNESKLYRMNAQFCVVIPHLSIFPKEIIRAADKNLEAKTVNTEFVTMARKTGNVNGILASPTQALSRKLRMQNIRGLAFDLQAISFFSLSRNEQ